MTKWEQILLSAIRRIMADYSAQATLDDKYFRALLKDLTPGLSQQREYKMLDILIKCNGNQIFADVLRQPGAASEAKKRTLIRRMEDDFVMDASAAERICALYLSAISGDSSYINRLDRQKPVEPSQAAQTASKPAPPPKPAAQKQSTPTQKPAAQPQTAPAQQPQVASSAKWTAAERALIDAIRRITNDGSTYPPKEDFLRQVVQLVPGIGLHREYDMIRCFLEKNTMDSGSPFLKATLDSLLCLIYSSLVSGWMTGAFPYNLSKEEAERMCELYLAAISGG